VTRLLEFGLVNAVLLTVLALLVALLDRRVRRPELSHLLWVLLLVKLVTPPLVPIGLDWPFPFTVTGNWGRNITWLAWSACAIWGAGSALWFLHQGRLIWQFHARLARTPPAPKELQEQAALLARSLGLSRAPQLVLLPDVISPMLSGIGRRIHLVFPAGLLERLEPGARDTLLVHELAHFRRGDHQIRCLELFVTGLYWWHPVVWWVRRRIEAAEEACCDALVLSRFSAARRVYAEAILEAIDFLAETPIPIPPVATTLGQVPLLRERLRQIMSGAAPRGLSDRSRLAVLLLAAALLPVQPVFLPPARGERTARDRGIEHSLPFDPANLPMQTG
jgi:beta-lactamase regulating signal transducer with metallopeptidase domain